jgi:hypothetical protein
MMTFTNIVTRVCNRLNKNVNDTTVTARIKNEINDACQEKWHGYAWSFRWREYPLVLSPQVAGSTLTATNRSQTVTASDTPFLSAAHLGQWLRFTADSTQAWYRIIKVVSTSNVTIEPAYQGTTGSAKAYQLCPTDYDLPTDLSDLGRVKITIDSRPLEIQHQLMQDGYFQPPLSAGVPYGVSLYTEDFTKATYSTGTITGTSGTNTLTGASTAWLTSILPGDEISGITGDSNTYKVQSVQSDTALTLYNFLTTSPSTAAYTATRQFQCTIRFQPCPDKDYVSFAKGLRRYNPLVSDSDTNELLLRFPYAVIESAVWREASSSPDTREDSLYMKSEKLWTDAQGQDTEIMAQTNYQPIFDARFGYR